WMGKPYVYDFDDAVYLPNVAEPNRLIGRLKCPGKAEWIIRGSRVTVAGNACLAEYAKKTGARNVQVVPTALDTGRFVPPEKQWNRDTVVIGWIGSPTTIVFLEPFRKVIQRLTERFGSGVEFRIVGGTLAEPLPAGVRCVEWSLETEVEQLQSFDIGIMPMPDNEWTRGKCAFKAIEYLAVGIPAVCSPVGMNRQVVAEGVNGFLPEDDQAWHEALCRLVEDKDLRRRLGKAGRQGVIENYSLDRWAPVIESILRRTAGVK
ncbi:MAG: glycosyltransferase family 4 protein, partial [Gemmatimonadota bacterium]|nr:glycosyltransferase family 4 protein [Gemmatimonadota bacterium]